LNLRTACRRIFSGFLSRRTAAASAAAVLCSLFAASSTETAVANGDTRTLSLFHSHTGESIDATFRVNGSYDPAVLEKLNYFLRDWRNNDRAHMDPRLFDVVWEAYRTAGATQPIIIISAYRSPETNAMLRARSHAVAEHSQHILGKAMDTRAPGLSMEQIREIGMRMQRGGVGYYQRENFVHLDVGNVRHWPRMSYDQIARLFPDGKTVHLASDGRPQPHYQEALAEISSRGGIATDVPQPQGGGLFAWLFGKHDQEEEAFAARDAAPGRTRVAALDRTSVAAAPAPARTTAAERRAARAAAAAPAIAAIEASNRPDSPQATNANKSLFAALTPPAQPAVAAASTPVPVSAAAPTPTPTPALDARDRRAGADQDANATDLDSAKDSKKAPAKDKAEKTLVAGVAPIPPARPADLVAYADVPTPPGRPASLVHLAALAPQGGADGAGPAGKAASKFDAAGPLARAASLPVVITRGPKDQPSLPAAALGYAASPTPPARGLRATAPGAAGGLNAEIVPARLDRSNYSELTSATPTAEAPPASILGQAFTGLRQAARIVPDALAAMPSAGYKIAFGAAASLLDCAHFAKGPAPASQPASPDGVSISEAPAARPN
jgi:uncharacterized protein YcbK (DUF882 family)